MSTGWSMSCILYNPCELQRAGHMRDLTRRDTTMRSPANWCEIFGLTGCLCGTCDHARLPPRTLLTGDDEAFNWKEAHDRCLGRIRQAHFGG